MDPGLLANIVTKKFLTDFRYEDILASDQVFTISGDSQQVCIGQDFELPLEIAGFICPIDAVVFDQNNFPIFLNF